MCSICNFFDIFDTNNMVSIIQILNYIAVNFSNFLRVFYSNSNHLTL